MILMIIFSQLSWKTVYSIIRFAIVLSVQIVSLLDIIVQITEMGFGLCCFDSTN